MHTCETCGKEWPENYCPECAHTIGKAKPAVPPPLPQPPAVAPERASASMGARLFGLFKKRAPIADAAQPHPHHRNFARMFIPGSLTRQRRGFLVALSEGRASQTLQEAWHKFGAGVLPPELLAPSTGLSVSGFQHANHICFLILFPPPNAPGESYFGFIVAGPSDDWSPEARAKAPVRYFLLERSNTDTPTVFEWRPSPRERDEEIFESLGAGPSPQNPPEFVERILSRFYGLKAGA